jgi:hypothetical protein
MRAASGWRAKASGAPGVFSAGAAAAAGANKSSRAMPQINTGPEAAQKKNA